VSGKKNKKLKPQSLKPAQPLNSAPRKAGFSMSKKMRARGLNINQMIVIFLDPYQNLQEHNTRRLNAKTKREMAEPFPDDFDGVGVCAHGPQPGYSGIVYRQWTPLADTRKPRLGVTFLHLL
jgi:hypothetical protein